MTHYLTVQQAMELLAIGKRTLYDRINDGLYEVKYEGERASNGKRPMVVLLSSLGSADQARWWMQQARAEREGLAQPVNQESALDESESKPSVVLNLAEISEGCRDEALRRLPIVQAAIEIMETRLDVTRRIQRFAKQHNMHVATLYSWIRKFQSGGYPALIPDWGKKKGTFTAIPKDIQLVIAEDFLQPSRPSPTTIYHRTMEMCTHLGLAAPSLATVNRFLMNIPQSVRIMARQGNKKWRDQMEPKTFRDLNAIAPNEWWCGDHRLMDAFVKFSNAPDAKIFRPWLTAWLDLGTRTCVGWHVCLVPDSDTIAMAMRKGMQRFGTPENLYVDNGKDYRSAYLNGKTIISKKVGLTKEARQIFIPGMLTPLGVSVTHAHPYQGWSKPIEPWFGHTFPQWERTLPGWCGSDNKQRPEKLKDEIKHNQLLTLAEFTTQLANRIDEYHHTEHSVMQATPLSKWDGVKIEVPNARALDLLLMRHKPVKVYTQGIKLFGSPSQPRFYWHDALALKVGHTVDVRYDPNEIGRLYVFDQGKFVCEAENQQALRMGASTEDLKKLHKRKSAAKKSVEQYRQAHRDLMNPDHVLEKLAEESQQKKVVNLDVQSAKPIQPQPGTLKKTASTIFDFAAKRITASRPATPSGLPQTSSMAARPGRTGTPSTVTSPAPVRRLPGVRAPQAGDSGPSGGKDLTSPCPEASMDHSPDDVLSQFLDVEEPTRSSTNPGDDDVDTIMGELLDE